MSGRHARVLCFLIVTILISSWANASPGVDLVVQQRSVGATAFFTGSDESGCIVTDVFVIANADSERLLPSPGTRTARVAIVISQFDMCLVTPILTGDGLSEDATIVVSPDLREASVTAVVPVLNGANGTLVDVFVDLKFTATSIMVADNGREQDFSTPGFFVGTSFNHTFRYATASGSVMTVDGELLTDSSLEAMIQHVHVGTVVVEHP